MKRPTDEQYQKAAKGIHHKEGEVEIDIGKQTKVSRSDDGGAYIQAWVWVYDDELEP